jgi:hypothetical protein
MAEMRRFGIEYIDRLLAGEEHGQLAELSSIICGSSMFSRHAPDYGLPPAAFLFVEALCWFAQAARSGVWTYYEATPLPRQLAMSESLRRFAPSGYAEWYARGMALWHDEEKIPAVDNWIKSTDSEAKRWLRQLAVTNRDEILAATA